MSASLLPSVRERRGATRYAVALPIEFPTTSGVTRNVSASGVLFETSSSQGWVAGTCLRFVLTVGTASRLRCRGEVVRIDRSSARCSVATTIEEWEFHTPVPA